MRLIEVVELLVGQPLQAGKVLSGELVGLGAESLVAAGASRCDERSRGRGADQDDHQRADDHLDQREPAV